MGQKHMEGLWQADIRPRVWAGQQHSLGWVVGSTCQEWKASRASFSCGADAETPARTWPHKNREASLALGKSSQRTSNAHCLTTSVGP